MKKYSNPARHPIQAHRWYIVKKSNNVVVVDQPPGGFREKDLAYTWLRFKGLQHHGDVDVIRGKQVK